MSSVFAIVVTYNGMQWLDRCLGSLASSEVPVNTVVIDNASSDGTPDHIAEHFPDVHLIRSEINYGFAKANNIGIRYALDNGAEYVFLLNQDAWIEKSTIGLLRDTFSFDERCGIVSPMHINGEGNALDWKFSTNMPGDFISDCYLNKLHKYYSVPYINAAAWMINKKCLNIVGGFDTNLFVHYGEDIDYCHRLAYWNLILVINTQSKIYHDREYRRHNDKEYKQRVFKRDDKIHNTKLEYGNIVYDIDIDTVINRLKKIRLIKLFKFHFSDAKNKDILIKELKKVKYSRAKNKSGHGPWLDNQSVFSTFENTING